MTTDRVPTLTEADIAALRGGSLDAFERLYAGLAHRMKSIAANLLGSRSDAEDAVHDAFIKVFRAAPTFDGRCPVDNWVIRILVNTCHDRLRQRRPLLTPDHLHAPRPDPALRHTLQQAIARLPLRQRTVFILSQIEGLRHAEIAASLDEPEGTIRSLLFDARQNLRASLRPLEALP